MTALARYLLPSFTSALASLGAPLDIAIEFEKPRNPLHGDITTSIAIKVAHRMGSDSLDVANRIIAASDLNAIVEMQSVASGFINLWWTGAFLRKRFLEAEALALNPPTSPALSFDQAYEFNDADPLRQTHIAHARITGVLRHIEREGMRVSRDDSIDMLVRQQEFDLIKSILRFSEPLEQQPRLNEITHTIKQLNELASTFDTFFHACRIIAEEAQLRNARLRLMILTKTTIENGLLSIPEG